MLRYFPLSLLFFAFAGIAFALQTDPDIAVRLARHDLPMWFAVCVNVAFIGVLIETLMRRLPRAWIALPVLYFGGYYTGWAWEAMEQSAILENASAVSELPFDPDRDSLVVSEKGLSEMLLRRHRVPAVFQARDSGDHLAHRLTTRGACDGLSLSYVHAHLVQEDRLDLDPDHATTTREMWAAHGLPDGTELCRVAWTEDPVRSLTVSHEVEDRRSVRLGHWRFDLPDGTQRVHTSGSVHRLSPFPMLVAGCGLVSSKPAWECAMQFLRTDARRVGSPLTARDIGDVLRLPRIGAAAPVLLDPETVRGAVAERVAREVTSHRAYLETLLAEPRGSDPHPARWGELLHAEGLEASWLPRIAYALEQGAEGGELTGNMASLMVLAGYYREPQIAPHAAALRAAIEKLPRVERQKTNGQLYRKLRSAGAAPRMN